MLVELDRLASEEFTLNVGHYLWELLGLHIFPYIEEQICGLFMQLVFANFLSVHVIVPVPLLIEVILGIANVMPKAKCAIVVDHTM